MPPKLVIFGASGGVGQELVKQAHFRGCDVVAVVRDKSKATFPGSINIRIAIGDVQDAEFVHETVKGSNIVLSALGFRLPGLGMWNKPKHPEYLEKSAWNIVQAMRAEGITRGCVTSAAGVGDSRPKVSAFFRFLLRVTALAHTYPLLEQMEAVFDAADDLDICTVRPSTLTDGPLTGRVQIYSALYKFRTISRADVAKYMLDVTLSETQYPVRKPILADT